MRKLLIAAALLATTGLAGTAGAQQHQQSTRGGFNTTAPGRVTVTGGGFNGGGYNRPGMPGGVQPGRPPMPNGGNQNWGHNGGQNGGRWGQSIGGHWYAGVQAPGGWRSYRRPSRGWNLPSYWISPNFYIADFASYGLSQPPYGYSWSRYYDDAVLVDSRGQVWDSVSGLNWDGDYVEQGYPQIGYAPEGYAQPYPPQGYAQVPIQQGGYYAEPPRQNSGVGGAIAGAVVGGVAGNLIAGRGNRLGGTLIGAGAGALVGQAIDKSQNRGYAQPGYGAGYPPPPPQGYGYATQGYAQPGVVYGQSQEIVQPYAVDRSATYSSGYYAGGYTSGATQTVVVQGPPIITETTTTTYIEETAPVTYRRAAVRRTYRAPVKRVVRRRCTCTCGC